MKKRLGGINILLFAGLFAVLTLTQAGEPAVSEISDKAAIARCELAVFTSAKFFQAIRPLVLNAAPPERHVFWNDLLQVIESSLNQRHDEARAGFDRLLADHPRSSIGDLNHIFLLRVQGVALGRAGDYPAAIRVYDDLFRQYGGNPDPDVRLQAAYAMNHRAVTFGNAGDFEGQIRAFDELIGEFKGAADEEMQDFLIASWLMKSKAYHDEGYPDESRRTLQEMEQTFPGVLTDATKKKKVVGIFAKFGLTNSNRAYEPINTLPKETAARLGRSTPVLSSEELEVRSTMLKAMRLREQRDLQAFVLYDEVITKHRDSENGKLQSGVAHAMAGRTGFFERLGEDEAAADSYRDFEAWAGTKNAPEARASIASGMFSRGSFLGRAGDRRGAIAEYDKLIGRFKGIDDDSVQMLVATALFMKAQALDESGDAEAAYVVVTELIETYRAHSFLAARVMAERAEPLRKKLAGQLGKAK